MNRDNVTADPLFARMAQLSTYDVDAARRDRVSAAARRRLVRRVRLPRALPRLSPVAVTLLASSYLAWALGRVVLVLGGVR